MCQSIKRLDDKISIEKVNRNENFYINTSSEGAGNQIYYQVKSSAPDNQRN